MESRPASAASSAFRELASSSSDRLEAVLRSGRAPSIDSLLGHEYRGFNQPARTRLLGIRKFIKGFFPAAGQAFGFNMRARGTSLEEEWVARPDDSSPRRFAFFGVRPADRDGPDGAYPHALLLDYAQGRNRPYDMALLLRDYLVRVEPDSDELLLGKAYFALGSARIPVGFFLLERHRPLLVTEDLERRVTGDGRGG